MRNGKFAFLLFILISLGLPPTSRSQDTVTGAFEGVVSDSQTGAALKGALVEIINQQTGVTISLTSDYRGRFFQGLLLPGTYRIRVSIAGYEPREVLQRLKITYTGDVVRFQSRWIPQARHRLRLVHRLRCQLHLLSKTPRSDPASIQPMDDEAVLSVPKSCRHYR